MRRGVVIVVMLVGCLPRTTVLDAGTDSAGVDAGSPFDASTDFDAGLIFDAGKEFDAGLVPDAGMLSDGGSITDAGVSDAGSVSDAGAADGGECAVVLGQVGDNFDPDMRQKRSGPCASFTKTESNESRSSRSHEACPTRARTMMTFTPTALQAQFTHLARARRAR
jgi:hypothetical protein